MAEYETKQFGGTRYNARREIAEQNRLRQSFERKLTLLLVTEFAKIGDIARREYTERRLLSYQETSLKED